MLGNISNAGLFLFSAIINMYVMVVILRLILPFVRANYFNPLCQFIVKLTDPVVKPMRNFIPQFKKIDLPVLVLLLVLQMVKIIVMVLVTKGKFGNPAGIVVWAVGDTLDQVTTLYFYAIIGRVIIGWLAMGGYMGAAPLQEVLFLITEPVMAPFRRFIPAIQGLDLSPIAVLLAIKVLEILFVYPLMSFGVALTL